MYTVFGVVLIAGGCGHPPLREEAMPGNNLVTRRGQSEHDSFFCHAVLHLSRYDKGIFKTGSLCLFQQRVCVLPVLEGAYDHPEECFLTLDRFGFLRGTGGSWAVSR